MFWKHLLVSSYVPQTIDAIEYAPLKILCLLAIIEHIWTIVEAVANYCPIPIGLVFVLILAAMDVCICVEGSPTLCFVLPRLVVRAVLLGIEIILNSQTVRRMGFRWSYIPWFSML